MKIICPFPESFGANTYLLISDGHAWVVDPAVSSSGIISAAAEEGAVIDGILLTHGHFDHMLSLDTLRQATGCEAWIHTSDAPKLIHGKDNAFYTFYGSERTWRAAEHTLEDGDCLTVGSETVRVLHTPGHTEGSCCFLTSAGLVTGDTLFADSFGRYDLPSGSLTQLRTSLAALRALEPTLTIYPGHGPTARLGNALDLCAYLI